MPPARGQPKPPACWRKEVARVLITQQQIDRRIRQLARQIERDYLGHDLAVVALLTGTVMFLADLIRHLSLPLRLDFMGVSSYGEGTESRKLVFTKELKMEVRGRDVLVVDDILDTGKTLKNVLEKLRALGPREIKVCVLLDKPARRVEKIEADYVGFEIPDCFVVGYGLDFAEGYRNLPFVGVLKPAMYETPPGSPRRIRPISPPSVRPRGSASPPLRISVRFHSYFRDLTGCAQTSLPVSPGCTLGDLQTRVVSQFPKLAAMQRSTLVAVGVEYQSCDYVLKEGDEVSMFPPVQGG